jgi:hypothetical protein
MGFNFGAFAGGVATGYEAAQKLVIQQDEANRKREELVAKMAKEQKAALNTAKEGKADNTLKKAEATMKYQKDLADATTAEEYAGLTNAYDKQMAAYDDKDKLYTDTLTELNPTEEQTAEVAQAESAAVDKVVKKVVAKNPELNQRSSSITFDNKSYAGNTKATNFLKMRQKAPNWQETTRVNDKNYEIEIKDKDGKWQAAPFDPLLYFPPKADKDSSTEMERAYSAYNKRTGNNIPIEEFKQKHWSPKEGLSTVDITTLPSTVQQNIQNQLGKDTKFLPQSVVNTYMSEDTGTTTNQFSVLNTDEKQALGIPSHAIVQKEATTGKLTINNLKTNEQVKIPEGMNPIYDSTGRIVEFVPIKGSKAYNEAKGAEQRQATIYAGTVESANTVIAKVEEALAIVDEEWFATGLAAQVTGWIGGTEGLSLQSKYNTINAIMGFEELRKMRAESKTGGALGQVTELELKLLQSTTAELNKDLKASVQKTHLTQVKKKYLRVVIKAGFYENAKDFGYAPATPLYEDGKLTNWKVMGRLIPDKEMKDILPNKEYNKLRAITGKKKQQSPFFK